MNVSAKRICFDSGCECFFVFFNFLYVCTKGGYFKLTFIEIGT